MPSNELLLGLVCVNSTLLSIQRKYDIATNFSVSVSFCVFKRNTCYHDWMCFSIFVRDKKHLKWSNEMREVVPKANAHDIVFAATMVFFRVKRLQLPKNDQNLSHQTAEICYNPMVALTFQCHNAENS